MKAATAARDALSASPSQREDTIAGTADSSSVRSEFPGCAMLHMCADLHGCILCGVGVYVNFCSFPSATMSSPSHGEYNSGQPDFNTHVHSTRIVPEAHTMCVGTLHTDLLSRTSLSSLMAPYCP